MRTIWRTERSSATTGGSFGAKLVRMTMRSRAACGCISVKQLGDELVEADARERQLHAPGLDLGEVEKVVDEADHVGARGVDVPQVVLVAVVADRPEAFLQHHLGKADDGVEGRADLVADLGEEVGLSARSPPRRRAWRRPARPRLS